MGVGETGIVRPVSMLLFSPAVCPSLLVAQLMKSLMCQVMSCDDSNYLYSDTNTWITIKIHVVLHCSDCCNFESPNQNAEC